MAATLKKISGAILPPPEKHDGRDQWPSRTSFLLATIGGAVGMGNMLRFPSQVYNNSGLQWFIPYLMAIFFLAIPCMMLEVSLGQAFRGGSVVSYNNLHNRLKGTGLGLVYIGFVVASYFAPILSWVMVYFRHSFSNPLPWKADGTTQEEMLTAAENFWENRVIRAPTPVENPSTGFMEYANTGMVGELVGWSLFTWFVVWLCMFRGVGLTGRAVYFTMGLPVVMMIIMIGRAVSLENAKDGIKLYFGSWHSSKLAGRDIWQAASSQVFFSTGVGFGYYTAYSSYNRKFSNPVQDSWIIVCSNCSFEILVAFAAFGVVGFLGMHPDTSTIEVGTYSLGFIVYPAVLAEMPGSQFFSVIFFFALMLVGISSTFAMLDAAVTLIMDSEWGKGRYSRPVVATSLVLLCVLIGLVYCTEFGYHLTNGVDYGINQISLVFVVFSEAFTSTSVYRYKDVTSEVGRVPWMIFNGGYLIAMVLGVAIGNGVGAPAGAGVGLGLTFVSFVVAVALAKTPEAQCPKLFQKNFLLRRFYFLAFYSGNQLRRDLNVIVSQGNNWSLPFWWPALLRFIASPILLIILSFAYPTFINEYKNDPIYIFGFAIAHVVMITCIAGFIVPRWFNILIPSDRMDDGTKPYAPNVLMDSLDGPEDSMDNTSSDKGSTTEEPKLAEPKHVEPKAQ